MIIDTETRKLVCNDIEKWRERHRELCNVVQLIDSCFGLHILIVITSCVPVAAFMIYAMVMLMGLYHDVDQFEEVLILSVTSLLSSAILLGCIIYAGTKLNTEVRS